MVNRAMVDSKVDSETALRTVALLGTVRTDMVRTLVRTETASSANLLPAEAVRTEMAAETVGSVAQIPSSDRNKIYRTRPNPPARLVRGMSYA